MSSRISRTWLIAGGLIVFLLGGGIAAGLVLFLRERSPEHSTSSAGPSPIVFKGHRGVVHAVAYGLNGTTIYSAGEDKVIRVWDAATGKEAAPIQGHGDTILGLCLASDGNTLASASGDKSVRIVDVSSGKLLHQTKAKRTWCSAAISPDQKWLVIGGFHGINRLVNLATGTDVKNWPPSEVGGYAVAWASDNSCFVTAGGDQICIWDTSKFTEIARLADGKSGQCRGAAISADSQYLLTAGEDRIIRRWDLRQKKLIQRFEPLDRAPLSVAFSPDGRLAVSSGNGNAVALWNVSTGKVVQVMDGHTAPVNCVAFSPDGTMVASGGADGTVRTWRVKTGIALAP